MFWCTQRVTVSRGGGLWYFARMCKYLEALTGLSVTSLMSLEMTFTWQGSWRRRKWSRVSQPPPTRTIIWRPFRSWKMMRLITNFGRFITLCAWSPYKQFYLKFYFLVKCVLCMHLWNLWWIAHILFNST